MKARKSDVMPSCASDLIKGGAILSVEADHESKTVTVNMLGCPDFSGGIRFGLFIMPSAKRVIYLWDGVPDIAYIKDAVDWYPQDLRVRGNWAGRRLFIGDKVDDCDE